MDSVGEGEGGKIWENGIEIYMFFMEHLNMVKFKIIKLKIKKKKEKINKPKLTGSL